MTEVKGGVFNPMAYDALLELATRIGGRYVSWVDQAPTDAAGRHWTYAHIEMQRQVRQVDPNDAEAIEAKRAELRELWATMPAQAPVMAA
ncbi:hypothetical protein [Microbacterium xanthum]|uniref:hypothetical protein n=1 Tax=Microbacterium xanthum TaxID=3079794 RepID=UPI002AD3FAF6|nr:MULTISPECIES: hypothetical protein [unclassified Microbacterium]MDZ8173227.1 hypothetical protein [Microbacterium sp. KSW-48]MDZ8202740.1 hypothetical protein [Microbacterium sp. SSW1-59]